MGVLPGWWLGEDDSRFSEPYITSDRWDKELRSAGFAGIDITNHDGYLNNNIVAMPAEANVRTKRITLLHSNGEGSLANHVSRCLRAEGYEIDYCSIEKTVSPPPQQDIVSILDLEGPFFHELNEPRFKAFQTLLSHVQDSGILWLTTVCQVGCKDPRYAMVNGIARVLRTEMSLDFATLELEDFDGANIRIVPSVVREFQRRISEQDVSPTSEWAHTGGKTLISRYHYIQVAGELKDKSNKSAVRKLEQHRPGLADSLYWKPVSAPELANDEVQVDVKAVGLNFKVRTRPCNFV
jgi:hypothetical protein